MGALTIAQVGIRQDDAGRFCLNDPHRAAGGESKHQPAFFMRRKETGDLIEALNSADPQSLPAQTVEGRSGGTFVAKELVYAYAMWISPAFHLQVIRAYDAQVTQRAAPLAALEDPAALRTLLLGYAERQLQLEQQLHEQAPKVEALDRLAGAAGAMCLTDAAKALQMRRVDLLQWMQEHAWIYRRPGRMTTMLAPSLGIRRAYKPRAGTRHDVGGGVKMTAREIALASGLNPSAVYARLKHGDTGETLLLTYSQDWVVLARAQSKPGAVSSGRALLDKRRALMGDWAGYLAGRL